METTIVFLAIFWNLLWISIFCLVHVMGHWGACRLAGVHIEQVKVGLGPVLWSRFWGDTEYQLRLVPIALWLNVAGLDEHPGGGKAAVDRGDRSFESKHLLIRCFVLLGGCLANLVLAVGIFAIYHHSVGLQMYATQVKEIRPGGPADRAGLQTGDLIRSLDGMLQESPRAAVEYISAHPGKEILFGVERQGQLVDLKIPVEAQEGLGKIGIISGPIAQGEPTSMGWGMALTLGMEYAWMMGRAQVQGCFQMARKALFGIEPTRPFQLGTQIPKASSLREQWLYVVMGLVSLNWWIVFLSMLPIPKSPFDGGRLLAIVWRAFRLKGYQRHAVNHD